MDQADIADEVITAYLERAIAAARGIREEASRHPSLLNCIECGEQIPEQRKIAIPTCKRCVSCEEVHELRNRGNSRTAIEQDAVDDIVDDILMIPV